jgi:hypothetical protein
MAKRALLWAIIGPISSAKAIKSLLLGNKACLPECETSFIMATNGYSFSQIGAKDTFCSGKWTASKSDHPTWADFGAFCCLVVIKQPSRRFVFLLSRCCGLLVSTLKAWHGLQWAYGDCCKNSGSGNGTAGKKQSPFQQSRRRISVCQSICSTCVDSSATCACDSGNPRVKLCVRLKSQSDANVAADSWFGFSVAFLHISMLGTFLWSLSEYLAFILAAMGLEVDALHMKLPGRFSIKCAWQQFVRRTLLCSALLQTCLLTYCPFGLEKKPQSHQSCFIGVSFRVRGFFLLR